MATPKTTVWEMDPHTRAKHEILRRYLDAWFPILGTTSTSGKVVFIDGFAGPGVYQDGTEGSPIIALRRLLEHSHFERLSKVCKFRFIFCEADPARATELEAQLKLLEQAQPAGKLPSCVQYQVHRKSFEAASSEIIRWLEAGGKLGPAFAFGRPLTPNGSMIGRLLRAAQGEVLINFMIDEVKRFATSENDLPVHARFEELFGAKDFRDAPPSGDPSREKWLLNLYENQLRAHGFTYVRSFGMINMTGHTGYNLVFGTKHPKGLSVMKDAMWGVDPELGKRFSDRTAGFESMFAAEPDLEPLQRAIVRRFTGTTTTVEEVEGFTVVGTDYKVSGHLRKALKAIEAGGGITKVEVRAPQRKAGTFPEKCRITFS